MASASFSLTWVESNIGTIIFVLGDCVGIMLLGGYVGLAVGYNVGSFEGLFVGFCDGLVFHAGSKTTFDPLSKLPLWYINWQIFQYLVAFIINCSKVDREEVKSTID